MPNNLSDYFIRYSSAPWMYGNFQVTVGGIGGIGSNVATALSAMNTRMLIYEFDTVDKENCGPQNYDQRHIGLSKFKALQTRMHEKLGSENVNLVEGGRLDEDSLVTPICFACFDSMTARKKMFKAWNKLMMKIHKATGSTPPEAIFIDGRMTAEVYQVYAIRTPEQAKKYWAEAIFDDSEVEPLACSYKSTIHIGMGITSRIIQMYANHIANIKHGDFRMIPFSVSFDGASMFERPIYHE